MYILLHDPSVCVFMYGQATESRWFDFTIKIFKIIPYMNTTTHGCDHEGPCKISTVLSLKSWY